ncbi:MAG TPA: hypothetical protein VFT51_10695 [Bacillales bacterium]|nr:hypothetical protein [Bacillales bacterium]
MRVNKRNFLVLLIGALFAVTFVSWAIGQALRLQIHVESKTLPSGKPVAVTPITDETVHTVKKGRAHKLAGLQLYQIELADPSWAELAQIYLSVGSEASSKDKWWVKAGVYYEVAADPDLILEDGTMVKRFSSEMAAEYLQSEDSDGLLMTGGLIPEDGDDSTSRTTLYIIGSYTKMGHNPPPGQQKDLYNLQFHCMVRM